MICLKLCLPCLPCLPACSEAEGALAPAAGRPGSAGDTAVVVGSLANSYSSYQLRLSARLAREHHGLRCVRARRCAVLGGAGWLAALELEREWGHGIRWLGWLDCPCV